MAKKKKPQHNAQEPWTIVRKANAIRIVDANGLTVATLGPSGIADARTIIAGIEALGACRALVRANNWGGLNGDSTDWEDINIAIECAGDALRANGEKPDALGIVKCHACGADNDERDANCADCDAHLKGSEQPGDDE